MTVRASRVMADTSTSGWCMMLGVKMRRIIVPLMTALISVACASGPTNITRQIRAEYDSIEQAYAAQDLPAILATRAEDLEVVDPVDPKDNLNNEQFAEAMRGWFQKNKPPIDFRFIIESIEIRTSDEVAVRVLQRASRYQEGAGGLRHVQHEVRQRETWIRTASGWRVKRIDEIDYAHRKVWVDGEAIPLEKQ